MELWAWLEAPGGAYGVLFWVLPYWVEGGAEPAPERGSVTQAKYRAYLYDTTTFWPNLNAHPHGVCVWF